MQYVAPKKWARVRFGVSEISKESRCIKSVKERDAGRYAGVQTSKDSRAMRTSVRRVLSPKTRRRRRGRKDVAAGLIIERGHIQT